MKIYLAIGVILASLFFLPFASASSHYSCDDSQIIIKLSSEDNAHAELYNGTGSYDFDICYDELFGISYTGGNEHICNGNNLVLKLYSETNSHAEDPIRSNYNVNVCFGDLTGCDLMTAEKLTPEGKCEIVSLSSVTNAHLGVAGAYSGDAHYKIVCDIPSGANG